MASTKLFIITIRAGLTQTKKITIILFFRLLLPNQSVFLRGDDVIKLISMTTSQDGRIVLS